jgi:hypothetical protein
METSGVVDACWERKVGFAKSWHDEHYDEEATPVMALEFRATVKASGSHFTVDIVHHFSLPTRPAKLQLDPEE